MRKGSARHPVVPAPLQRATKVAAAKAQSPPARTPTIVAEGRVGATGRSPLHAFVAAASAARRKPTICLFGFVLRQHPLLFSFCIDRAGICLLKCVPTRP